MNDDVDWDAPLNWESYADIDEGWRLKDGSMVVGVFRVRARSRRALAECARIHFILNLRAVGIPAPMIYPLNDVSITERGEQ